VTAVVNVRTAPDRTEIEDFLYAEAALLDTWALDDWLQLFSADAKYEVPCNDAPDGDPARDLLLIDDNVARLRARVERLNSRRAHREYPHSRTNHQVFNVRVDGVVAQEGGKPTTVSVSASFTVWRFRGGRSNCYVGRYRYRLLHGDNGYRISYKRAELDMTDLRTVSDVAIIL
jgi:p-cumate 2,3-dioxygenase beta subunit